MTGIFAINGSPRRNKNTAKMLDSFLDGAGESGKYATERIDLFDYNIRGCTSCFACKRNDPDTYGVCALRDDVYDILQRLRGADGLVFGSPVYFGNITGQLLCFVERLLYPLISYEKDFKILTKKRMPTAFIYTMNMTEEQCNMYHYPAIWAPLEDNIGVVFSRPERVCAYNTYQFDNYSKYKSAAFNESEKARHRDLEFPKELQDAYEAGKRMADEAATGIDQTPKTAYDFIAAPRNRP